MVADIAGKFMPTTLVVRRLVAEGRSIDATILFDPRLGETHEAPRVARRTGGLVCTWGSLAVALNANLTTPIHPGVPVTVTVEPGHPITLVLAIAHREPLIHVDVDTAWTALESDERRWQRWTEGFDDDIPFREAVVRSLLTLRLLTYSPSGAPVAAPTTSLPEALGGIRNWDYRFAWPRDASIGVGAFLGVGKQDEARLFLAWLLHASRLERPHLPVLLTLHGSRSRPERTLDGWPGYAESRPVRVGNGAADQHQLDTYGWVIDAAWLFTHAGQRLNSETWRALTSFADRVAERWRDPDAGIWEIRDDAQQHVHSKLMAWLALDRALRIADTHRLTRSASTAVEQRNSRRSPKRCEVVASTRHSAPTRAATKRKSSTRHSSCCHCSVSKSPTLLVCAAPSTRSHATSMRAGRSSIATRPGATGCRAPKERSCRAHSGSCARSPRLAARRSHESIRRAH